MRNENIQELLDYGMSHQVTRAKKYKSPEANRSDLCDHYDHSDEESRRFWASLDRFLLSCVGLPFNKVYSEFCSKWPAWIGRWTDTRWAIRNECNLNDPGRTYNDFIIDDSGILQKNSKSWRWRKKDKKTISLDTSEVPVVLWEFNKSLFKYEDITNYLYGILGRKRVKEIKESEYITQGMVRYIENCCETRYSWHTFLRNHPHWEDCGRWVYRKVEKKDVLVVEKGTASYSKITAERRDARRKVRRENLKQKKQVESVLLHDLEQKAKEKERAQNEVDRDRLGFDNQSFIGEPYHGQKRKKNKRN